MMDQSLHYKRRAARREATKKTLELLSAEKSSEILRRVIHKNPKYGFCPEILLDKFEKETNLLGVEIGVAFGWMSTAFLLAFPKLFLLMIDSYEIGALNRNMKQLLGFAWKQTYFAKDRRAIIVARSALAHRLIEDESLDFVFIDGNHSYRGAMQDLEHYVPKVKKEGLILLDDYDHPKSPRLRGVTWAVNAFAKKHGFSVKEHPYHFVSLER